MIYVRWKKGESRRGREFTGKDPAINRMACTSCLWPIGDDPGSYTLVAVGPLSPEDEALYEAGKWFNAGATLLHTSCLDRLNDLELDQLCRELVVVPEPREDTL